MEKTIGIIEEWLSECSESEDPVYLNGCLQSNHERLLYAIFTLLEERSRFPEIYEQAIKQIFMLAKSKDQRLSEFVLFFAPSLIYIYLSSISMGDKKSVGNIEYTLLALYNSEVLDEQGQPRVSSFRLPTLARESIYHDPTRLSSAFFTTDSLHRLEAGDAETVRWGSPRYMDSVTAATRYHLVTALLVAFNARLATFPKIVLMHFCKSVSKLVCQGFNRPGHHHKSSYGSDGSFGVYPRPIPRIHVTSELLAEMTHTVYFAIPYSRSLHDLPSLVNVGFTGINNYHYNRFNDFASLGIQALEDIHMRAQYELFADVLLMTNAIINSLKVNPSGQPSDGPMGISIALTPAASASPFSKSCITNASFRTKKLPDDIPIQRTENAQDATTKGLKSITEEGDVDERENKPAPRKEKDKTKVSSNLPPLTNLVKKRDKDKTKNGDKKEILEKKGERGDRKSKEKLENRSSGTGDVSINREVSSSNRNSVVLSTTSDSDGTPMSESLKSTVMEMKPMNKTGTTAVDGNITRESTKMISVVITNDSGNFEDSMDGLTISSSKPPAEVNGSENHIRKVS